MANCVVPHCPDAPTDVAEVLELQEAWPAVPQPPPQEDLLEATEATKEDDGALDDEGMSLECSVWDVALLIGLTHKDKWLLTPFQTVVTIILMLCNISMQLFVTFAVDSTMAPPDFSSETEHAVLTERLFQNHRFAALDFSSLQTKTHQLCQGRVLNLMQTTYSDITSYLKTYTFGTEGVVVAFIAMTIWILSMSTELRRVAELFGALMSLPRTKKFGKKGLNVSFQEEEDVYMIKKVSCGHKLWYAIVLATRATVALLLLIFGLRWLAGTIVVENLILNACALEIVKSVDEFIFDAVMGYDIRLLVENSRIAHIPIRKRGSIYGLISLESFALCFRLVMIVFWIVLAEQDYLKRTLDRAASMKAFLCEKDVDFVWDKHPVIGLPFFAHVKKDQEADEGSNRTHRVIEELQCSYAAVYDMLRLRSGFSAAYFNPSARLRRQFASGGHSAMGEVCEDEQCPEITLTAMTALQSVSSDEFYSTPGNCQDYAVHFEVLRGTCMNESYRHLVPWFHERPLCTDFSEICTCPGTEESDEESTAASTGAMKGPPEMPSEQVQCGMSNFTDIMTQYDISYEWIETVQKYCPRSCNLCNDPPTPAPAGENNKGMGMGGMGTGMGQKGGMGQPMGGSGSNNSMGPSTPGNMGLPQQPGKSGNMFNGPGGPVSSIIDDSVNETDDNETESEGAGRCVCSWISGSSTSQGAVSTGSGTGASQGTASQGGASQGSAAQGSASQGSASQSGASQGSTSPGTSSEDSVSQGSGLQGSGSPGAGRRLTARLAHQLARVAQQSRKTNAALRRDRRELLEEQRRLQERNLQLEARLSRLEQQLGNFVLLSHDGS